VSLNSLLNVTVSVLTPGTPSRDAAGGYSDTVSSVTYPAAVQLDSSRVGIEFQRETKRRMFNVYFGNTVTINANQRLKVASGQYAGVVLIPITMPADHAGRNTYRMISATEAA